LDANTFAIVTPTTSPVLQSAALANGPYTDAAGQSLNLAIKTITVPKSGSMQFYRIRSNTALTMQSITVSGGNMVITYN